MSRQNDGADPAEVAWRSVFDWLEGRPPSTTIASAERIANTLLPALFVQGPKHEVTRVAAVEADEGFNLRSAATVAIASAHGSSTVSS